MVNIEKRNQNILKAIKREKKEKKCDVADC